MVSQTNEQALEAAIEKKLTGTCLEDLKSGEFKTAGQDLAEVAETRTPFDTHHGYEIGYPQHFNPRFAVDDAYFSLFYPAPLASSALRVKEQFQSNVFSATRQVHYSLTRPTVPRAVPPMTI